MYDKLTNGRTYIGTQSTAKIVDKNGRTGPQRVIIIQQYLLVHILRLIVLHVVKYKHHQSFRNMQFCCVQNMLIFIHSSSITSIDGNFLKQSQQAFLHKTRINMTLFVKHAIYSVDNVLFYFLSGHVDSTVNISN